MSHGVACRAGPRDRGGADPPGQLHAASMPRAGHRPHRSSDQNGVAQGTSGRDFGRYCWPEPVFTVEAWRSATSRTWRVPTSQGPAPGQLHGRVLELGAGRGANFPLLAPDVAWVGIEPATGLRRRLARKGHDVLAASAEAIPLSDGCVDAVLSTVVLCSVRDQDRALSETARVLRPGGRFVFFEHVAAPRGTWFRRLQQLGAPFNRAIDHGCHPARETWRGAGAGAVPGAGAALVRARPNAVHRGLRGR